MGSSHWHVATLDVHLRPLSLVYCTGHSRVNATAEGLAAKQASKAVCVSDNLKCGGA